MLFELPDHNTLYEALLKRDDRYDGQVFVCVATTGIFCRLTCPARKPKPENCTFFSTIGECIEAGYRACKRCHPLQPAAQADPAISALLNALDKRPDIRWSESHITQMGFDLSTVRRSFKRQFGITFLEMARQRRLREGFETLAGGDSVISAQHEAGFDSPQAFRTAFAKLLGCPPSSLPSGGFLRADWISTTLGDMIAVSSTSHLHLLEFTDRKALPRELSRLRAHAKGDLGLGRFGPTDQIEAELSAFFSGRNDTFATPLALHGSAFTKEVWHALLAIPAGHTRSYSQIAREIGRPTATRAVARANGANQIAVVIPCHRVLGADGALTGYGGGLWRKQKLLEIEQQYRTSSERLPA
ncbi:AraC family transcriptional regulator of adaptative response/methylated-DNA-[protein]-cysteine methyltransferase [Shimia isoporae]|uniref:methylated-DNA--[protein]-cysteine S-methyltransferase n=1 Tax=Shimia isoporae TaxID=647720 RepID=A0A4R1NLZ3_9RHOB|nr:trifunctional transcriptional activator/DNA repair protein Ada/methylated-DNA--[protein]-cysteine S-methyltransferase [Shimia isoporae]TCL08749.1 AraC family transcriptional regulator of adaptative response/methylated-DNA-[protein]-cysteine methyltransferase [Shimia isoporae]